MGIRDLQEFIETDCQSACKPVDLLKIGRTYQTKRRGKHTGRLRLVVDAESCLDRLYGGFYSDWACGGQWNRMTHFLGILIQACQSANMELVVFFNGAFETDRLSEWAEQVVADKKKVASVLKHIHHKATPPPKVWWLPPVCLRQCLRMSLRQMGVTVACSMDDHHQEVIAYCRENSFQGLLGQDADYAIFDPPRFFSSHNLKLTYKQALETKEYMMNEVAHILDLNPNRFCVLATLLGNHILSENDLKEFFEAISAFGTKAEKIKAVAGYIRAIYNVDDLDEISKDVFSSSLPDCEGKKLRFKKSVQYYMNGTQDGFLNYKPKGIEQVAVKLPGSYPSKPVAKNVEVSPEQNGKDTPVPKSTNDESKEEESDRKEEKDAIANNNEELKDEDEDETEEPDLTDLKADKYYTEAESGYGKLGNPEIVVNSEATPESSFEEELSSKVNDLTLDQAKTEVKEEPQVQESEDNTEEDGGRTTQSSSGLSSSIPRRQQGPEVQTQHCHDLASPDTLKKANTGEAAVEKVSDEIAEEKAEEPEKKIAPEKSKPVNQGPENGQAQEKTPQISPEIMRIASERHQKGLMSAWIYQVLSQAEVKLGITLEDENSRELPSAVELYRNIRQNVYAILFDMNKRRPNGKYPNGSSKDVSVKEWTIPRGSSVPRAELVKARPLDWKVPTVRRLWLGQAIEDKNRRLRAFLSCMKADNPRMLNICHVPQHLLIMACVLRYMVLSKDVRVLRKHELDAFLCASVSPLLHDVETMQEMKLPMITSRGAQLAALFMRGVETAIFANDACGAPIPWSMCCPWLFFDGKLFHFKLLKANNNTPLLDMCDGQMDQMMRVERLRGAILDGIPIETLFAKPGLPLMQPPPYGAGGPYFNPPNDMNFRPAGASHNVMGPGPVGGPMGRGVGRGRGLLGRSPVDSRGGQLQIAGVVVGNWGPNVQANHTRPGSRPDNDVAPPHVTAVGPRRCGLGGGRGLMRGHGGRVPLRPGSSNNALSGRNQPGMPRYNTPATKSGIRGNMRPVRGSLNAVRTKSRIRGPAGYNPKVTLEQKNKTGPAGRGCTVENPMDSNVVSVSQFMNVKPTHTKQEQGDDCDCGQFVDAEPVKHAEVKPRLEQGQGDEGDFGQFYEAEPVKHAEVKVNLDQEDDTQIGTWVPWNHSE